MKTRRQHILDVVNDLAVNFLYYNRKEDEDLRVGEIEDAVANREITVDEIIQEFRSVVEETCKGAKT